MISACLSLESDRSSTHPIIYGYFYKNGTLIAMLLKTDSFNGNTNTCTILKDLILCPAMVTKYFWCWCDSDDIMDQRETVALVLYLVSVVLIGKEYNDSF